jgi:hypothetical protein
MTNEEIVKRFAYHPPKSAETVIAHQTIRGASAYLAGLLMRSCRRVGSSRWPLPLWKRR